MYEVHDFGSVWAVFRHGPGTVVRMAVSYADKETAHKVAEFLNSNVDKEWSPRTT